MLTVVDMPNFSMRRLSCLASVSALYLIAMFTVSPGTRLLNVYRKLGRVGLVGLAYPTQSTFVQVPSCRMLELKSLLSEVIKRKLPSPGSRYRLVRIVVAEVVQCPHPQYEMLYGTSTV